MGCEPDEVICQSFEFLRHSFPYIGRLLGFDLQAIGPFISPLIAVGSLAFAIYAWYRSYDSKMFQRLKALLETDDAKLLAAGEQVLTILKEPGPAIRVTGPKFSNGALTEVLNAGGWNTILPTSDRVSFANARIDEAVAQIKQDQTWVENRRRNFDLQLATAFLTKGAIAAARAQRLGLGEYDRKSYHQEALVAFQTVLGLPTKAYHLLAKECEGEQYQKLGQFENALTAFAGIEAIANASQEPASIVVESLAVSNWRRAETLFLQRNSSDRAISLRTASGLMNQAISGMPEAGAKDVRGLFRFAKMHELHYRIRAAMPGALSAAETSRKTAVDYYNQVQNFLGEQRKPIWHRLIRVIVYRPDLDRTADLANSVKFALKNLEPTIQATPVAINPTSSA